jgi:hypothetical protein
VFLCSQSALHCNLQRSIVPRLLLLIDHRTLSCLLSCLPQAAMFHLTLGGFSLSGMTAAAKDSAAVLLCVSRDAKRPANRTTALQPRLSVLRSTVPRRRRNVLIDCAGHMRREAESKALVEPEKHVWTPLASECLASRRCCSACTEWQCRGSSSVHDQSIARTLQFKGFHRVRDCQSTLRFYYKLAVVPVPD